MEPKLPAPNSLPEPHFFEQKPKAPELPQTRPEAHVEIPNSLEESREFRSGQAAGDASSFAQAASAVGSQIVPVAGNSDSDSTDDTPLVASDDDLIEKTWIDKAKHIVSETKTDPYQQEREVSKLQASYLLKRYGKQIKSISKE